MKSRSKVVVVVTGSLVIAGTLAGVALWRSQLRNPTIEPSHPLEERGLENIVAFARLFGWVRFFHPSDAAAEADWNAFALHGVREVESADTDEELVRRLEALFKPIAPTVCVLLPNESTEPRFAAPGAETGSLRVVRWKHRGVQFGGGGTYRSWRDYADLDGGATGWSDALASLVGQGSGTRERTAEDAAIPIPDGFHDPRLPERVALTDDVVALVPLGAFVDDTGTLPRNESSSTDEGHLRAPGVPYTADDRGTRLADVVLAWTVFQHFYPYFDVIDTDWDAALREALSRAAVDENACDFLDTLRRLVAKLDDGHGNVYHRCDRGYAAPPVAVDLVEGKLVVTAVADRAAARGIRPGMVVRQIDGRSVEDAVAALEPTISAATEQWLEHAIAGRILHGAPGSEVELTLLFEREATSVRLRRTVPPWVPAPRDERFSELRPGIWYVDLDRLEDGDLATRLEQLAAARGVIFDLRGYPRAPEAMTIPAHLTDGTLTSPQWHVPMPDWPDRHEMAFVQSSWPLFPREPQIEGKVAFLAGGGTISAGETLLSIVEHYGLAEIVGGPTAGTNGNVNPFELPGGYRISWTGMKVLKHDGSRHHGVGIRPTVPVSRTIAGVAAGRDEVLERAVELVSK